MDFACQYFYLKYFNIYFMLVILDSFFSSGISNDISSEPAEHQGPEFDSRVERSVGNWVFL